MEKNKIMILVLSTQDKSYVNFKNSIENSWFKVAKSEGISCYFYEGGHDISEIDGNIIRLRAKDDLLNTASKLIEVFEVIRKEFPYIDVVFRTNLSSYIDIPALLKFVEINNVNKRTYLGVCGETYLLKELFYLKNSYFHWFFSVVKLGKKLRFASGSGFFLGSDNIDKVINRRERLFLIDDVMVGYNLDGKLEGKNILRFDIEENNGHKLSVEEYNGLKENGLFHYRIKTKDRLNDAALLASFADERNLIDVCTH